MSSFVHIVTVGTSILINARRKLGKEPTEEELLSFVREEPRKASAELNTILPLLENRRDKQHVVYLLHSDTSEARVCAHTLKKFLSGLGLRLNAELVEIKGLGSVNTFHEGLGELFEQATKLIMGHYASGDRVFVHATGGFKPESTMVFLAANFPRSGAPVFYIHESFREVLRLPAFPFWPRRKQKFEKLMDHMCRVKEASWLQLEKLSMQKAAEEAIRLGWLEEEEEKVKLTKMGHLLWERFERLTGRPKRPYRR